MDSSPRSVSTVEECDNLLASYAATGLGQHDSLVIRLKRRRNALLPVAHLPRELRCLIFDFVLPRQRVGQTTGPPKYSRFQVSTSAPFCHYLALFTLRQVSRSWDLEICGTPSLWTVISTLFSNPFQELIWKQSRNMPLDVEVTRKDLSPSNALFNQWTEEETAFLERVMQRDIRELEMHSPFNEDPTRYFIDVQYPKLKALYISSYRPFEFASPLLAPQLADFHLFNGTLPWDSLTNLRSLTVRRSHRLTLARLLRVLSISPLLEQLELDCPLRLSSDGLPEEDVSFGLLHMPRLTKVRLGSIPCNIVVSLLGRLNAPACGSATIVTVIDGESNPSALCQQAGRLCRSLGSSTQGHEPCLSMLYNSLGVQIGDRAVLSLIKYRWDAEERGLGFSQRSQLIRLFLKECEGPRFKDPIPTACLKYDSKHSGFEGIKIIGDFWPQTSSLSVRADAAPAEVFRALSENRDTGDGSSKWCLPKLTEIGFTMDACAADAFDGLVDTAIERTQAARVSPSTVSPITRLVLKNGTVRRKSLTKLDELGIRYSLDGVKVRPPPGDFLFHHLYASLAAA